MSIQFCRLLLVDEHHGIALMKIYQQRYLATISFQAHAYHLSAICHEKNNYCLLCRMNAKENTPCLYFSLHEKDVIDVEKTIETHIKKALLHKQSHLYVLKNKKSEDVMRFQHQIILLNALAIKRNEVIESYGSTFDYYCVLQEKKRYYITLKEKKRKTRPRKTQLLHKKWVDQFIASRPPVPDVLTEQEEAIIAKYDVEVTKWNKTIQLVEIIKKSMLAYNSIEKSDTRECLQDFLVFLFEVLYREIPIHPKNKEDFLRKHEQIMSVLQLFIVGIIEQDDCLHQLIKEPHDYVAERKERVVFTVKALLKSKEALVLLREIDKVQAEKWHYEVSVALVSYLKIELGIVFESTEQQPLLEERIFDAFTRFQKGKVQEVELLNLINHITPFVEEGVDETINRYLQKINTRKPNHLYYLMEIKNKGSFNQSLSEHIAYKGLEEIELTESDFLYGEHYPLLNWMNEEEAYTLQNLMKEWEKKTNDLHIWKVKTDRYSKMDEYILWNEEKIYRLHFRKR